jgi:hypothetical protein
MRAYSTKLNKRDFEIGKFRVLLLVSVFFLASMYLYFVINSVFSTVERETISKEISKMGIRVSALEAEYIKMRSAITMETATQLGFSDDFNKINFANISGVSGKGGLSYVTNEI